MRRAWRAAIIMVMLAALGGGVPGRAGAAAQWTPVAPMGVARADHAAAVLGDGSVIVTGGSGRGGADALASAERFEPARGRWVAIAPLGVARASHTATLLADGGVLVVGGHGAGGIAGEAAGSAERFDPASGRWAAVASPAEGRVGHTATLLGDGSVLIVGGGGYTGAGTTSAERWVPGLGRWVPAGRPVVERRQGGAATPLADGRVLVTGGIPAPPAGCAGASCTVAATAAAEVYDPATGVWGAVASMGTGRADHTATLLPDGRVLVVGGTTAEVYDPVADRWAATAPIGTATVHAHHTATLLPDGTVLVVGGFVAGEPAGQTVERFTPATGRWSIAAPTVGGRAFHTASLLPDGRLLVAGGGGGPTATAEVFADDGTPAVACFRETGFCLRGRFLQHWRANGGLAINGYPISDERIERLEDGREYLVQYFERTRLEYHPENAPPHDVLLGQFGRRVLATVPDAPTAPVPPGFATRYYPETGHNVLLDLHAFWEANGGLAQFGYPLTEEFRQTLEDGREYTVQYFERARFERHPENAAPNNVQLGQFGRIVMAEGGGGR